MIVGTASDLLEKDLVWNLRAAGFGKRKRRTKILIIWEKFPAKKNFARRRKNGEKKTRSYFPENAQILRDKMLGETIF